MLHIELELYSYLFFIVVTVAKKLDFDVSKKERIGVKL